MPIALLTRWQWPYKDPAGAHETDCLERPIVGTSRLKTVYLVAGESRRIVLSHIVGPDEYAGVSQLRLDHSGGSVMAQTGELRRSRGRGHLIQNGLGGQVANSLRPIQAGWVPNRRA
jgi:hypothetical protein